ncbi:MAG TPA: hypothetical protein VGK73_30845 [Polyangiaceae bacterium]
MLAKRLPLVTTFAAGCLSGAAVLGFWLSDTTPRAPDQRRATDRTEHSAPAIASMNGAGTTRDDDVRGVAATQPAPAKAADHARHVAPIEPPPNHPVEPPPSQDESGEPHPEPGSSVADVLSRLEAQYRKEREAAVPREAVPSQAPAPAPSTLAALPAPLPAPLAAATLPSSALVPPASARRAEAQPAAAAAPAEARPVHVNIGSVHNGDVHQSETVQVQQVAIYQYVPLLTVPLSAQPAPTSKPRRVMNGRERTSPTAIMNPDNPWGFDFPPTILVK